MKALKFILIILFLQAGLFSSLYAGDIAEGSVPTEINYQGRLEKDNAPITGPVHITFRIYDAVTGGNLEWASSELVVNAIQGIFSASIEPSWSVFATTEDRYLEVQIESDVLSPREPFQSAAFALVSKRLEDGSNISISSMTTTGSVTVNNDIIIGPLGSAYGIHFPDGSIMTSNGIGSANNISALTDAIIISDSNNDGSGNIIFRTGSVTESARITDAGNMGIGNTPAAGRKLDVAGSLYIGNEGIYDRDDTQLNIKQDLIVEGGRITGSNDEYISLGETDDIISFWNTSERMRVYSDGNVGIGLTVPTSMLHVSGDIVSNDGVRGGNVSIGDYAGAWTGLNNEIRSIAASHLLLQQSNTLNVGIGLTAPTEKLHVHGSIKADNGIIASTAAFSGDVAILGVLNANNPLGSNVELSSTVIYGTLQVTGGIASDKGYPAYLTSTQTLSGENTFLGKVTVSNDVVSSARVGAGVIDYDFGAGKYLQIGDNIPSFASDDALAYLVAGSNANSKIHFYRGATEAARFETQSANNIALYAGGVKKMLVDSSNFRIFNTEFFVSATEGSTPAIYVSPTDGNVGMGTTVLDPNWQLTVDGNIRIAGSTSNGIIFADGTTLITAGGGSASALSNNGDVLIRSDADSSGAGDIIINAGSVNGIFVNSGGNIGMGTQSPVSKLNLRGGDLVLGNPYLDAYASNGKEDLIMAGSLIIDGGILQRSASTVYLSALTVSGAVHLSTAASAMTGIGNEAPSYRLDVTDDINASGNIRTGGIARISATGVIGNAGANATWDGITIDVNRGGTGATTLTGVLKGNGTSAVSAMNGTASYNTYWSDANTIEAEQYTNVTRGGTGVGTFASNGILFGNTASAVNVTSAGSQYQVLRAGSGGTPAFGTINLDQSAAITGILPTGNGGTGANLSAVATGGIIYKNAATTMAGTGALTSGGILYGGGTGAISALAVMTNGQLLIGDGSGAPTIKTLTGTTNRVTVSNTAGTITLNAPQDIHTAATPTFAGLDISAGSTVDMNTTGKITNLAEPSANQDAATKSYVDGATGGGKAWGLSGNNIDDSTNFLGTTGAGDDLIFKTVSTTRMTITSAGGVRVAGFGAGFVKSDASGNLSGSNGITLGTDTSGNYAASGSEGGSATSGDSATSFFSSGTIEDDRLSFTLANAVTDGGCTDCILDSMVSNTLTAATATTAGNVSGTVAVANGGTGRATLTSGSFLMGNAANDVNFQAAGLTGSYTVATDTDTASCQSWTFTNGLLTNVAGATCP
jgi:hypothetical protein